MRIIIPGGTGFIGRPLSAHLAGLGHELIVLSRHPEAVKGLPAGVRAEKWDGRTAAGWGALVEGAGAIVNLAGQNIGGQRWSEEHKYLVRQSRREAGAAIVEAVGRVNVRPKVVIQASGVGYYGVKSGGTPLEETAPAGDDFLAQVAAEDWEPSTAPVEAMGVRRVITRSGVVLGQGEGMLPKLVLQFRLFAGGPLGSGRQWYSWIHLADQVRAIAFLIEREDARGIFNLAAPEAVTGAQMATTLGKIMRRPSFVPAPAFALKLALGEMSTLVLDGQRVTPRRLLEIGFEFEHPTLEHALRDLLQ